MTISADANSYAQVDGILTAGLRLKGDGANVEAAAHFARAIALLEEMAASHPAEDTLERLDDARDFAERTARAKARVERQVA
jgi:hypothetical protein